jgi:hypothetical protein
MYHDLELAQMSLGLVSYCNSVIQLEVLTEQVATSTTALLGGRTWESKVPGLSNRQLVRKLLLKQDKHRFPHGKDWPGMLDSPFYGEQIFTSQCKGVMWQATEKEQKLPEHERYIHSCHVVGNIKICVTVHPKLAEILHSVLYLCVDFTFKRVAGATNEYAIVGWSDRYQCRMSLNGYWHDIWH